MITGLTINTDGSTTPFATQGDHLRSLQKAVGGYVEIQRCGDVVLWFNEEGKIKDLPVNKSATLLWWNLIPDVKGVDALRGTVIVTGGPDSAGETQSLNMHNQREILAFCGRAHRLFFTDTE